MSTFLSLFIKALIFPDRRYAKSAVAARIINTHKALKSEKKKIETHSVLYFLRLQQRNNAFTAKNLQNTFNQYTDTAKIVSY
jgi:hypothetical protein